MDIDITPPLPRLVDISQQVNNGMLQFNLDNELIQQGETRFFPMPINTALPFIKKAQAD